MASKKPKSKKPAPKAQKRDASGPLFIDLRALKETVKALVAFANASGPHPSSAQDELDKLNQAAAKL